MDGLIGSSEAQQTFDADALLHDPPGPRPPTVNFSPAELVRHELGHWRGVHAETIQITNCARFEYGFKHTHHLLVAIEHGVRRDGELLVEGLPASNQRSCSHKLILVPAGRRFVGWQSPKQLTRSICIYIDPATVAADPDCRFDEAELEPRMLFDDTAVWQTIAKLKGLIGSGDPSSSLYAEALGGVLTHELLRLHGAGPAPCTCCQGGLAPWQRKRIIDVMEAHLADTISLATLAAGVQLSRYHFVRAFKQSFGEPPHRYWTARRIERAKVLLADPRASVTAIALDLGFSTPSAFASAFRRIAGRTPTDYRRMLE